MVNFASLTATLLAFLSLSLAAPANEAISAAVSKAANPWNDSHLIPMFDGKTLHGWNSSIAGGWVVQNGALHPTGNARGYLFYNKQNVGDLRWIFHVRRFAITGASHDPCVLIWGTTTPRDALGAIQFQPPNAYHWDYRPGHNNAGNNLFKVVKKSRFDVTKWAQCEIVATMKTGTARMACCELGNATSCKATEVIDFADATAGRVGPLALQVHNAGIQDEYKDLWIESPVVDKPGQFITV